MQNVLARPGGDFRSAIEVFSVKSCEDACRWKCFPVLSVIRGTHLRLALPIEYLPIIRRIVCEIIKFWNFSGGNRQAHEKKQNGEYATHISRAQSSTTSMIAPNQPALNLN
jgi:hypothetical protein